jgi:hypothetical protein
MDRPAGRSPEFPMAAKSRADARQEGAALELAAAIDLALEDFHPTQ